ncbi:MAG: hypothetical protein DRP45_11435, partial [Candidatus Zixiibacteriota bacterium]
MPFDDSQYFKVQCTTDTPLIRLAQGQTKTVNIVVRDDDGNPLDLDTLDPGSTLAVKLAVSHFINSATNLFELEGTIDDASAGQVSFEFLPEQTDNV